MVEGSCCHCNAAIQDDENYQYQGTGVYLCEDCGYNKPVCQDDGCGEIIDSVGNWRIVGDSDYHEDCVPDGSEARMATDKDLVEYSAVGT